MAQLYFKAINLTTGRIIADKVRIAQDPKSRAIGLLGRGRLEPGEGLLIKPCNSIHMFFMRFPIDAIFLDKSMKIVRISHNLKPWCLARSSSGYMTLELEQGVSKRESLREGDFIKIE